MEKRRKDIAEHLARWNLVSEETRLRIHDLKPDFPLAPLYCNLRICDNPDEPDKSKLGWLSKQILPDIAAEMREEIDKLGCSWVAGIPNAGTVFAREIAKIEPALQLVTLAKNATRIDLPPICKKKKGALVDDIIGAGSSKEKWFKLLRQAGAKIAAIFVVIDREEGGRQFIQKKFRLRTISLFRLIPLVHIGVQDGGLQSRDLKNAIAFRDKLRAEIGLNGI